MRCAFCLRRQWGFVHFAKDSPYHCLCIPCMRALENRQEEVDSMCETLGHAVFGSIGYEVDTDEFDPGWMAEVIAVGGL